MSFLIHQCVTLSRSEGSLATR